MTAARPSLTIPSATEACGKHYINLQPTATPETLKLASTECHDNAERQCQAML